MRLWFRVKTLTQEGFHQAAADLLALVRKDFQPDIYIGIRTGGYDLAKLMVPEEATLLVTSCRRPGTAKKESMPLLKKVLKKLPYFLSNPLRVLEHIYLTQRKPPQPKKNFVPNVEEMAAVTEAVQKLSQPAKILIIDDAVDSGATFAAIAQAVRDAAGIEAEIKLAAITVTTEYPLVQPDYKLFRHVLCRFPWSFDFHG